MNPQTVFAYSLTSRLIDSCYHWLFRLGLGLRRSYRLSRVSRVMNIFWQQLKLSFPHSRLRMAFRPSELNTLYFSNSSTIRYLLRIYQAAGAKLADYSARSTTWAMAREAQAGFNSSAMEMIARAVIIAITVNIVTSLILQQQIGWAGYLMRGLFLFLAFAGLFSGANWSVVKDNSLVFKK